MFEVQIRYSNTFEGTIEIVLNIRTSNCTKNISRINNILDNSNQCKTYVNVKNFFSVNNRCDTSCAIFSQKDISDFWSESGVQFLV